MNNDRNTPTTYDEPHTCGIYTDRDFDAFAAAFRAEIQALKDELIANEAQWQVVAPVGQDTTPHTPTSLAMHIASIEHERDEYKAQADMWYERYLAAERLGYSRGLRKAHILTKDSFSATAARYSIEFAIEDAERSQS